MAKARIDILEREQEIRQWISENESNAEIARRLNCKVDTLKSYYIKMVDNGNSMGQMDLKTAIVFVTEAYESGMEKARSLITNEHNEEDY